MTAAAYRNEIEPQVLRPFLPLYSPKRYKIARGGRGGAKSHAFAEALILQGLERPLRILCTREHQVSINDSVKRLLDDKIDKFGLRAHYDSKHQTIVGNNGTEITFKGLRHNIGNVKSLEGYDIVWVEEAAYVPAHSWSVLIPTMRKEGSEIWASYNPDQANDYIHQLAESDRDEMVVMDVCYLDNPWISDELLREAEFCRTNDPEGYAHIWLGKLATRSEAQVYGGHYVVEPFTPQPNWGGPYFGLDFGFKKSVTVLVKCWTGDRRLWIEHEGYGRRLPIEKLPKLIDDVPGAAQHTIRADNARPETIHYLQTKGYPKVVECKKWSGSVEDGIEYLRGNYETIVIHPRCTHTQDDFRMYSHKVDKDSGDVLDQIVKDYDDAPDATRYALEPMITARRGAVIGRRQSY